MGGKIRRQTLKSLAYFVEVSFPNAAELRHVTLTDED